MPTGIYPRPFHSLICSVEGCDRPYRAKGLCNMHWQRQRDSVPFDFPYHSRRKSMGTGKGWVSSRGYRYVMNNGVRILEHRLMMERLLGRTLLPSEIVHHKDNDKTNNDPSNLQIVTWAEHLDLHRKYHRRYHGRG